MFPYQRILVPTDFSLCAEAAYRQGLFLAQQYGAEVHFLHVDTPMENNSEVLDADGWPAWIEASGSSGDAEHWRDILLRRVRVAHADPAAAILDYAHTHEVDLIVIGAHGDRGEGLFLSQGVEQAFLGRTAEQVLRHAACPVCKVMMRGGGYPELVQRLLVLYDGSTLSSLALVYARDLAARYDARLDLLHVIEQPGSRKQGAEAADEDEARAHANLVDAFENTRGPAVSARFYVARGHPDRVIRTFVRRHGVDLVVQGAHSDEGRDILGIVAAEVARTVPSSVLTVRARESAPAPLLSALPMRRAVGL